MNIYLKLSRAIYFIDLFFVNIVESLRPEKITSCIFILIDNSRHIVC